MKRGGVGVGRVKLTPPEKLLSKSPALLGLKILKYRIWQKHLFLSNRNLEVLSNFHKVTTLRQVDCS